MDAFDEPEDETMEQFMARMAAMDEEFKLEKLARKAEADKKPKVKHAAPGEDYTPWMKKEGRRF